MSKPVSGTYGPPRTQAECMWQELCRLKKAARKALDSWDSFDDLSLNCDDLGFAMDRLRDSLEGRA
jgi:hypothetical protein